MKPGTDAPTLSAGGPSSADLPGDAPTIALTPTPEAEGKTVSFGSSMMEEVRSVQTRRGLSLATKYFLMATSLIAVTIGSAVAVTAYRANVVADLTVKGALSEVGRIFSKYRADREMVLRATIRTLADEPQTRALLAEDVTPETVKDWALDKTTTAIGAAFLAVLDAEGAFIARSDKPVEELLGRPVEAAFVKEAMSGTPSSALVRERSRIFVVAASPVQSGEGAEARLEGILFAGYPLDDESAKAIATIAGTDVTFVSNMAKPEEPARPEVAASTLGPDALVLLGALQTSPGAMTRLFEKGEDLGPLELYPAGDHVIAVGFPLKTGSGDVIGAFVASRSLAAAKAAFTQIQRTLLVVGLVSLVVAVPASYLFGRRIARPLVTLAASAHAIREGKLDVVLPEERGDEVGLLARSFAQMVAELREKAELEKFIAGMGLSAQDVTHGRAAALTETAGTAARRAAETPLEVGTTLGGRYVIEGLLGQGGMGSVWRARDKELDEPVALKVIRKEMLAADASLVSQLKEEIKLARRITHPNVLRTHDFGDLDGVRFISMEFVAGPTLRTVVDKRGAVSLPVGLQLGRQICRGLAAAHDAGVIHRDIKPHNIIVAPNGTAKIMDFGIALAQERHDAIGGGGQVVGTPDYMSPEQIEGKSVDARADIYAVGIVLYEMFTGIRPFHAATTVQTLMRNLNEVPPPMRQHRPDLPAPLDELIMAATAKRPEDRIQSASELRKLLGKISS